MRRDFLLLLLALGAVREIAAAPITFNTHCLSTNEPADSAAAETLFLDAIQGGGFTTIHEDFEDAVWTPTRSPAAAGNILSHGILWNASTGNLLRTYPDSDSYDVPQPYMVFTYDPLSGLHTVPNTIIGVSSRRLYAVGMWMDGTGTKGKVKVIFDDSFEVKFERVIGYEPADPPDPPEPITETVRLTTTKEFFGVYVPEGFNKFQLLEFAGEFDEVVLMWARTFTFAVEPVLEIDVSRFAAGPGGIELDMVTTTVPTNLTVQSRDMLSPTGTWADLPEIPVPLTQNVYRLTAPAPAAECRIYRVYGSD